MTPDLLTLVRELRPKITQGPWKLAHDRPMFGDWTIRQDPVDWDGSGYQFICSAPSSKRGAHYGEMFKANASAIALVPALMDLVLKQAGEIEGLWREQEELISARNVESEGFDRSRIAAHGLRSHLVAVGKALRQAKRVFESPEYHAVFQIAHIHNMPYRGEKIDLESAVAALPSDIKADIEKE